MYTITVEDLGHEKQESDWAIDCTGCIVGFARMLAVGVFADGYTDEELAELAADADGVDGWVPVTPLSHFGCSNGVPTNFISAILKPMTAAGMLSRHLMIGNGVLLCLVYIKVAEVLGRNRPVPIQVTTFGQTISMGVMQIPAKERQ